MKSHGIGFFGFLALIFIALKLAEVGAVAGWSWWWVLSPLWVWPAIILILAGVFGLASIAVKTWERR